MARHAGHDVLLQLGPLTTDVVREDPDNLVRRRADLRASALPSIGADAYHSHAAPHLLPSPPVWPKRGKRPSAPPARSNRKAMALIIGFFLNAEVVISRALERVQGEIGVKASRRLYSYLRVQSKEHRPVFTSS